MLVERRMSQTEMRDFEGILIQPCGNLQKVHSKYGDNWSPVPEPGECMGCDM